MFLLIGLALSRTTLCACSRSFWGGADNCSLTGLLIWPAHLFRHFLRRVLGRAVVVGVEGEEGEVLAVEGEQAGVVEEAVGGNQSTLKRS